MSEDFEVQIRDPEAQRFSAVVVPELQQLDVAEVPQAHKPSVIEVDLDKVWLDYTQSRRFFHKLRLAADGGFQEVPALFTKDRFLYVQVSILFLCMNLYLLLVPNLQALSKGSWILSSGDIKRRGFVNTFLKTVLGEELRPDVLLALLELSLLLVLLMQLPVCMCQAWRGNSPGVRWNAVRRLLWSRIPNLMTFSSMRLLNFVTPGVFVMQLNNRVTAGKGQRPSKFAMELTWFFILRILSAMVGLEAFTVKFIEVAFTVLNEETSSLGALVATVGFLNQILGIVQISPLLQKRLFVFLFGGEDSFLSCQERAVMRVWGAMIAQAIWLESQRWGRYGLLWFFSVTLTFSDVDFQRLTLNERENLVRPPSGKKNSAIPDMQEDLPKE